MNIGSMISGVEGMIGANTIESMAVGIAEHAGIESTMATSLVEKAHAMMADGSISSDDIKSQLAALASEHGVNTDMIEKITHMIGGGTAAATE